MEADARSKSLRDKIKDLLCMSEWFALKKIMIYHYHDSQHEYRIHIYISFWILCVAGVK